MKVTILENGPAIIEAEEKLEILSPVPPTNEFTKKVAICRCGRSQNGVWCDGSHSKKKEENKTQE